MCDGRWWWSVLSLLAVVAVVVVLVVDVDGSSGCYCCVGGQCTVVVAVVWSTMWVVAIVVA